MATNLKKIVKQKLEPIILEKGFTLDEKYSKFAKGFIYVKSYGKELENDPMAKELREEILIYRSRWAPEITAELRSAFKRGICDIGSFAGYTNQAWWPVRTEEEAEQSIEQIKQLMEKYAWDWFAKKDAEDNTKEVKE